MFWITGITMRCIPIDVTGLVAPIIGEYGVGLLPFMAPLIIVFTPLSIASYCLEVSQTGPIIICRFDIKYNAGFSLIFFNAGSRGYDCQIPFPGHPEKG